MFTFNQVLKKLKEFHMYTELEVLQKWRRDCEWNFVIFVHCGVYLHRVRLEPDGTFLFNRHFLFSKEIYDGWLACVKEDGDE